MPSSLTSLVKSCYSPPLGHQGDFSFEKWIGTELVRYYSLGRHALIAALQILDVGPGDIVALPEFICRDLLASVASVGASVAFYPVGPKMELACPPSELRGAKAVLVVNYFGFPQNMQPFKHIANEEGITLIEDNAHGFLSRDADNVPLGRRTELGIFSLRKSVPLVNGGALVVNSDSLAARLPEQLPASVAGKSPGRGLKKVLRGSVPLAGPVFCRGATAAARFFRKITTGHAISPSASDSEVVVPLPPGPYGELRAHLSRVDAVAEVSRRRWLYGALEEIIIEMGGSLVFDKLPSGVSPYVLPFRPGAAGIDGIRRRLSSIGLECHRWPELPEAIVSSAGQHYLNVWMVPFLW
jgi:hypothetical protein